MGSTQKENARAETWIALLGRKDVPADGIADYCECLGQNLAKRGIELKPVRIEWVQRGWLRALRDLWRESKDWRGSWVLLQFTALGWSNHGFPGGALACTAILRFRRAKCAIVFHEPFGDASGSRALDRVRCAFQNWTIRTLHRFAQKSIFTIPLNSVPWLLQDDAKSALIPIGSNIPENLNRREATERREGTRKTAVVFCVSESPHREREVGDIAAAM